VARNTRGHAKGLISGDTVTVSSANWSEPGLSTNAEASLRIDQASATEYFAESFDRDWNLADA
jgi:phosphatidylserine/phosphatidylglycerophosphate/cardiolipin synthase-like enzyme